MNPKKSSGSTLVLSFNHSFNHHSSNAHSVRFWVEFTNRKSKTNKILPDCKEPKLMWKKETLQVKSKQK